MNYDHYVNLRFSDDYYLFMFHSDGPKGRLKKLVVYTALRNLPNGYNLGFGTLKINNDGNEYLDGNEISDNGDRNKILATIAITAYKFLDRYPDKCIYLTGSNEVRTRLYQMAISHAYDELSKRFIVLGDMSKSENDYDLIPFTKGMNYNGFLIKNR